jgi:thiamine-phosphate pyrophosphorylase
VPSLYPIVDLTALAARGWSPEGFAEAVLEARPRWLQLRAKRASARDALAVLDALLPLCRRVGTELFMNDRPDLALIAGADGVHLGQDDLPVAAVRRIAPGLKLGVSTHDLSQLERALDARPDYVALGPIFATGSKENPDPVVGLEMLARAVERASRVAIPVVAIGGIDAERIREVAQRGASAALIAALLPARLNEVSERAQSLARSLLV